jgi:putative Ca2+/H+ antiporter (TMEM165/GDT1 family)
MDPKLFLTVFTTVFLAELGDKTQLATFLYAADSANPKMVVFLGAALALVLTSAIGVLVGAALSSQLSPRLLNWVAGLGFVAVGVWTLARGVAG